MHDNIEADIHKYDIIYVYMSIFFNLEVNLEFLSF